MISTLVIKIKVLSLYFEYIIFLNKYKNKVLKYHTMSKCWNRFALEKDFLVLRHNYPKSIFIWQKAWYTYIKGCEKNALLL